MKHLIKIDSTPHGVLGVRHTGLDQQYCEAGDMVVLEWQPDSKWGLQEAHYTDGDGNITPIDLTPVKVDGMDVVVFTMPDDNITVGGTFKRFVLEDWTGDAAESPIFNEHIDATDQQRNTALANVSNQTANSTTGKMGYKVLDPTKTFAEQVTAENTIYEIRDVFDFGGTQEIPVSVTIPAGSTLKFNGGAIKNCTLVCSNTYLDGDIKLGAALSGSIKNTHIEYEWFVDKTPQEVADYALALSRGIKYNKSLTLTAPLSLFDVKDVYIANVTNSETNYIELGANAQQTSNSHARIDNANYVVVSGGKSLNYSFQNVDSIIFRAGDNTNTKGSLGYCYFEMGCHNSIKLQGIGGGWINDNVFMGGRYISSIEITGDQYYLNHNIFIAPHIEKPQNGTMTITFRKCSYNKFTHCRMEEYPTITQESAYCNTIYQDFNNIYNQDILQALASSYFGKGNSRSFCTEDLTIQSFTIDKNLFKNGRDCDKVSLCDKLDNFRLETTGAYIRAIIHPDGNNFGFSFKADGESGTLRHYVYLYDKNGDIINDNYLDYIKAIGNYTTTTGLGGRYYSYTGDVKETFSQINIESINSLIGEGVQIGWIIIAVFPNNVRKTLRSVNCVFASYKSANIMVSVTSQYKKQMNISTATPAIKETISGINVPHSILDGEYCEYNGFLYKRSGNDISIVGQYNGRGTTTNRPDASSVVEGYQYYDTTIKKWIMSDGTAWVNLDGTALS